MDCNMQLFKNICRKFLKRSCKKSIKINNRHLTMYVTTFFKNNL